MSTPKKNDMFELSVKTRATRHLEKNTFPIMRLPAELRNHVYKYVMLRAKRTYLNHVLPSNQQPEPQPTTKANFRPALLLVNHQISEEAMVVLYGVREFAIANSVMEPRLYIEEFIESATHANMAMMRNITLEITFCCARHCEAWPQILGDVFPAGNKGQKVDKLYLELKDGCKENGSRGGVLARWMSNMVPILNNIFELIEATETIVSGDCPDEYLEMHTLASRGKISHVTLAEIEA